MGITVLVQGPTTARARHRVPLWLFYTYYELLKLLRQPPVLIFGLGFPTAFFALFGLGIAVDYKTSVMASYAAYAAFVVPFSAFSNSLAVERGLGWNKLLRTTPLNAALDLAGKTITILFVGILSMLILFLFAATIGQVSLSFLIWMQLMGALVLGMLPFIVMGFFVGLITGPISAPVISTLVFLLLSFTSGLFVPILFLPKFLANIAPFLPTYHLGQLAWIITGKGLGDGLPLWLHFLWLAGYGIIFLSLALWAYNREERKNFG